MDQCRFPSSPLDLKSSYHSLTLAVRDLPQSPLQSHISLPCWLGLLVKPAAISQNPKKICNGSKFHSDIPKFRVTMSVINSTFLLCIKITETSVINIALLNCCEKFIEYSVVARLSSYLPVLKSSCG